MYRIQENIQNPAVKDVENNRKITFIALIPIFDGCLIWEYELTQEEIKDRWDRGHNWGDSK
jgi:hypothetical protein